VQAARLAVSAKPHSLRARPQLVFLTTFNSNSLKAWAIDSFARVELLWLQNRFGSRWRFFAVSMYACEGKEKIQETLCFYKRFKRSSL
jgi:hypothetical protein